MQRFAISSSRPCTICSSSHPCPVRAGQTIPRQTALGRPRRPPSWRSSGRGNGDPHGKLSGDGCSASASRRRRPAPRQASHAIARHGGLLKGPAAVDSSWSEFTFAPVHGRICSSFVHGSQGAGLPFPCINRRAFSPKPSRRRSSNSIKAYSSSSKLSKRSSKSTIPSWLPVFPTTRSALRISS